jgi:hypothetical protein
MGKVNTESVIMISFNANDEIMWENYFYKTQVADLTTGLTNASVLIDVGYESVRMVYATSNNPTGIFNVYNYVEWDAMTGSKVKEVELQNPENLALVRNYSIFLDDKLVLSGRKGLLGKKYIFTAYKFESGN